jgi:hypothetical protein
MQYEHDIVPAGQAAAAFVAAGIGCFALGVFTTLAEISAPVKSFLNWTDPTGPLSGKTGMAVLAWLIAWGILHFAWKDRTTGFGAKFVACLILIALGAVGTFPPFFLHFSH